MLTREFLTAGDAMFTVEPSADFLTAHPTARKSYTFCVKRDSGYFRVAMLTGSEADDGFTYIAKLDPEFGHVNLTRGSHVTAASWPYRILARIIARVWAGDVTAITAAGWKIVHNGRCVVAA